MPHPPASRAVHCTPAQGERETVGAVRTRRATGDVRGAAGDLIPTAPFFSLLEIDWPAQGGPEWIITAGWVTEGERARVGWAPESSAEHCTV